MALVSSKSVRAGDYPLFPIENLELAIIDAAYQYCVIKGDGGHSYEQYHCEVHDTKSECHDSEPYECHDETFFERAERPCDYCGYHPNDAIRNYKHFWPNGGKPISRLVHLDTPVEAIDIIPINHDWNRKVYKYKTSILVKNFRNEADADIWVKWVDSQYNVVRFNKY